MTATACLPAAQSPTPSAAIGSLPAPASISAAPSALSTSPAPSPSPSPSPSASSSGLHVTAVASLPADPHYFAVGQGDTTRILLFDSAATRPPVEVIRFDPAVTPPTPDARQIAFGASADGRVLVIARRFSEQRTVHYLVRPQTGEIVVLLTDLAPSFGAPVVSPDGTRYAYSDEAPTPQAPVSSSPTRRPLPRPGASSRRTRRSPDRHRTRWRGPPMAPGSP